MVGIAAVIVALAVLAFVVALAELFVRDDWGVCFGIILIFGTIAVISVVWANDKHLSIVFASIFASVLACIAGYGLYWLRFPGKTKETQ